MRSIKIFASSALVLVSVALAAPVPAIAQAATISGTWNGGGVVTLPSGNTERVRCRATISQRGDQAYMTAMCATPSMRVNQTAELVRVSANRFTGDYLNRDYGVSGSIRVTVSGNSLNASLSGGGGSAQISMNR
jgi:hypothetical protein